MTAHRSGNRRPAKHRPSAETRRAIFAYVRDRIAAGAPPTVREVQREFGFKAVQSAQQHLAALVAAGRLEHEPGTARGYRLPAGRAGAAGGAPSGPGRSGVGAVRYIPLLGRVQAGALQEAIEDPDGWLPAAGPAPGSTGGHGVGPDADAEHFALTVRGESMTGAGILPGDVVVVRRQDTARDGEIVVAGVEGEATVKRLKLSAGRIVLQPENPAFAPIEIAPDTEIRILGRVVEVRRRLA